MTTTSHPSSGRLAPSWVVTLSSGGVERGMVGPFPDPASAEAWAEAAVADAGRQAGLSWRCEPVVAPHALPQPGRRPPRRHLRVVA